MPTASDELREEIRKMFNGTIDCKEPLQFLLDKGYTEKAGMIRPAPRHIPTTEEWTCIEFLCDEWDFGYKALP